MRKLFVICLFALSLLSLYARSVSYIRPSVPMEEKEETKAENTGYVRPATPMEKKEENASESKGYIRPATPMEKTEKTEEESTGYVRRISEKKTDTTAGSMMEASPSTQENTASGEENSYSTPITEEVKPQTAEDFRPYIFVAGEHIFSGFTDYGYISIYLCSSVTRALEAQETIKRTTRIPTDTFLRSLFIQIPRTYFFS